MKKILLSIAMIVSLFIIGFTVNAETIDSNDFLTLDKEGDNYIITILEDVSSTELQSFLIEHFETMFYGDITIKGKDDGKKITNNASGNVMIGFGTSTFTRGVAATYNSETESWSTDSLGWYGYNQTITFENVDFVGTGSDSGSILVYIVLPSANFVFRECSFKNYKKAAIWTANFKNLLVEDCSFDGIDIEASESAPELYGQSSESISLCLGDEFIVGSSSYSTHQVESITIRNNTFENVETETANGTGAIKIKIKNKTVVSGVDGVTIEGNTFRNNGVDVIVGEKNPERAKPSSRVTTPIESADINIIFSGNNSSNVDGLKLQTVHDIASASLEDRTHYITSEYAMLYNGGLNVTLGHVEDTNELILEGETNLEDALEYIQNAPFIEEDDGLVIEGEGYSIFIEKKDIKDNRDLAVNDLTLEMTSTLPEGIDELAVEGSILISSTFSGGLPAEKITVRTKVADYANKDVQIYFYNEETEELELVTTVRADASGIFEFVLTHYSEYVLMPKDVQNPETIDNISVYAVLGSISLMGLLCSTIYLKKKEARI